MTTPLLRFRRVSRTYPPRGRRPAIRAVDDVDLHLDGGETVAVIGPSGAGKSTLFRLALALEPPDSGSVEFDGQDFSGLGREPRRRVRRRFQSVFQDPYGSLDPHLVVWRTVVEPLLAHDLIPTRDGRHAAGRLLAMVGLDPAVGEVFPSRLSGGERQRVAIARAVGPEPDLLLLDEPVSALDSIVRGDILALISSLHQRLGTAILLVSHSPSAARAICQRTVVMDRGRIVEDGPTEVVLTTPSSPTARTLVAAAAALDG